MTLLVTARPIPWRPTVTTMPPSSTARFTPSSAPPPAQLMSYGLPAMPSGHPRRTGHSHHPEVGTGEPCARNRQHGSGKRSYLGESGCESGEEDAGASGTLNRAACGPAWLAATDHWASPSSPGLACCLAASAHAPVTRAAGVPAAGCAGQPWPDGCAEWHRRKSGVCPDTTRPGVQRTVRPGTWIGRWAWTPPCC